LLRPERVEHGAGRGRDQKHVGFVESLKPRMTTVDIRPSVKDLLVEDLDGYVKMLHSSRQVAQNLPSMNGTLFCYGKRSTLIGACEHNPPWDAAAKEVSIGTLSGRTRLGRATGISARVSLSHMLRVGGRTLRDPAAGRTRGRAEPDEG